MLLYILDGSVVSEEHIERLRMGEEGISQGLKPAFVVALHVRAEARTYLRGKSNDKSGWTMM